MTYEENQGEHHLIQGGLEISFENCFLSGYENNDFIPTSPMTEFLWNKIGKWMEKVICSKTLFSSKLSIAYIIHKVQI